MHTSGCEAVAVVAAVSDDHGNVPGRGVFRAGRDGGWECLFAAEGDDRALGPGAIELKGT